MSGQKCSATSTTTGKACGRWATPGATVCPSHGSRAPQVRAAAARRVEQEKAARQLQALGRPVEVDPASALLGLVHAKAGEVAWLREKVREVADEDGSSLVWGRTKVKDGGDDRGTTTEAKPNIWWTLLRTAEDQLADYASRALKAGIEERRVRLAEDQGLLVAGVIRRILGRLDLTAAQQLLVPEVVPQELRALEAGVVSGFRMTPAPDDVPTEGPGLVFYRYEPVEQEPDPFMANVAGRRVAGLHHRRPPRPLRVPGHPHHRGEDPPMTDQPTTRDPFPITDPDNYLPFGFEHRAALDWCAARGLDADQTPVDTTVEYGVDDQGRHTVTVQQFTTRDDGSRVFDEEEGRYVRRLVTVLDEPADGAA